MAELVDAPASGAGAGNGVEVRVLFRHHLFFLEHPYVSRQTRRNLPFMAFNIPLLFTFVLMLPIRFWGK
jgi:hypothetical protein